MHIGQFINRKFHCCGALTNFCFNNKLTTGIKMTVHVLNCEMCCSMANEINLVWVIVIFGIFNVPVIYVHITSKHREVYNI
jgi:hypothetical protein